MKCPKFPCTASNIKVAVNKCNSRCKPSNTYETIRLKPNFCCKINSLTQEMLYKENAKYVIEYDFSLLGQTITVPKNCILEFDGGTLSNGTIIGQDTYINDVGGLGVDALFGEGITRKGTWRMNEGGGSTPITIDNELSDTSTNPVQNKVIKGALDNKQDTLNSGQNIKTINGESILGGGNIQIEGGGSQEQVQSDWNETNPQSKAFIKNKPADVGTKVQSDWNQIDSTKPDYIKNKPTIPEGSVVDDHLSETSTNPVQNKVVTEAISENRTGVSSVNSTLLQLVERVATDESTAAASKVALEAGLQTEKTQRETSDTTINARIAAEEEARAQKDTSIDNDITALRTGLGNVYNKIEVNNLISNTPESDIVVIQGQEGVDPVTLLPATGAANTLYRIMSADGTSFSEYGWNGSAYVLLANKNTGVDTTPTPDSNKFVLSDGVAKTMGICKLANGTVTNSANTYGVRTWFVPCVGMTSAKIETNRPNSENCLYMFGITLISLKDMLYTFNQMQPTYEGFVYNQDFSSKKQNKGAIIDLTRYSNAVGIAYSIVEYNYSTKEYNPLRTEDFEGYYVKIENAELAFSSIKSLGICDLRNASPGNPGNTNAVTTWFIPVANAKSLYFETNRPNKENCLYRVGWYTLLTNDFDYMFPNINDDIDESLIGPEKDYRYYSANNPYSIENANIKSVACVITEYNTQTTSYSPLRVEDFIGYNVILKTSNVIENNLSVGGNEVRLRNGSLGNTGSGAISTEFIAIGSNKFAAFVTNRPNKPNCEYRYGWGLTADKANINTFEPVQDVFYVNYSANKSGNIANFTDYPTAVAIAFEIAERNILSNSWEILKEKDFEGYYTKIEFKEEYEGLVSHIINGDSTVKCTIRNGSGGNPGNVNAVSTFLIPTLGYSDFELWTNRPNPVGYHYTYTVSFGALPYGDTGSSDWSTEKTEFTDVQYLTPRFSRHFNESRGVQITFWERSNVDNSYHPLRITDFDGYDVYITRRGAFDNNNVVSGNQGKLPLLIAACHYRKHSEADKDFQMLIVTDTHEDHIITSRAIEASSGIPTIDAVIHCGDVVGGWMGPGQDVSEYWKNIVSHCTKPFYFVIGNHEAGNWPYCAATPTDSDLYNNFIKPSVDAGHLLAGEYVENKCYYYHDFNSLKKRLIVIDEYETPLIFDSTDWLPIAYNSSLQTIRWNTQYNTGDEVNDIYYKGHSFRAVHSVKTPYYIYSEGNGMPRYKYEKGARWISQTQAQWFLNTLLSTPAGYGVIVACHAPFSENAVVGQNFKFSQKGIYTDGYPNLPNHMANDFIADAINAFQNGTNFTANCTSKYPNDIPGYTVSADFSRKNSGVKFYSVIGGHTHKDFVWKHNTYNQIDITPICSNSNFPGQCPEADIRRATSDNKNYTCIDSFTTVTYRENQIVLIKLGVDVTEDLEKRDFEVIDIE